MSTTPQWDYEKTRNELMGLYQRNSPGRPPLNEIMDFFAPIINQALQQERDKRLALAKEIGDLIEESNGVDGLHKNGDVAWWYWLQENGWLTLLNESLMELGAPTPTEILDTKRSYEP